MSEYRLEHRNRRAGDRQEVERGHRLGSASKRNMINDSGKDEFNASHRRGWERRTIKGHVAWSGFGSVAAFCASNSGVTRIEHHA